jgi:hypothetical protein
MTKLSDTIRAIVSEQKQADDEVENTVTDQGDDEETLMTADEDDENEVEELAEKEREPVKQDVKSVAKKFLKHRDKKAGVVRDKWGQKIRVKEDAESEEAEEITEAEAPKAHPSDAAGASRMAMINDLTKSFVGMAKSDQVNFFNTMMATMKSGNFGEKDTSGANKSSIDTNGDAKSVRTQAMKEDVAELFGDEQLSEEFKEKATTLFEAAVAARALEIELDLEEAYEEALTEELSTLTTSLTEQVENVLNQVLESWYEENKVAVESQLRADLMDDFIEGLKNLFKENYIEIPDDKVDVVETLNNRVDELEEKLNKVMTENAELKDSLLESDKDTVFDEVAEGLTVTQTEKFRSLSEGVTFDGDLDGYARKLALVKENYFTKTTARKPTNSVLTEEVIEPENGSDTINEYVDPVMQRYLDVTARVVKK